MVIILNEAGSSRVYKRGSESLEFNYQTEENIGYLLSLKF